MKCAGFLQTYTLKDENHFLNSTFSINNKSQMNALRDDEIAILYDYIV